MNKNIKKIVIPIVIIAVLVVLGVFKHMASKVILNDKFVNGNSAGNLYNEGLFVESDGIVYFANPDDGFTLYSMNANGSDLTKLSDDVPSYLNADTNYIYYTRNQSGDESQFSFLHIDTNSLCRIKKNGHGLTVLEHDLSTYAALVGNYIYYLHYDKEDASTLYRIRIDGEDRTQVSTEPLYACASDDKYLYYSGQTSDHYIYKINTQTNASSAFLSVNAWMPIISGDYAYYMDLDRDYAIVRTSLSSGDTQVIVSDRVDSYNLDGNTIYYQTGDTDSPALCKINADGSNQSTIVTGNHSAINVTSNAVYFKNYGEEDTIYCVSKSDGAYVSAFHPGKD